MSKKNICIYGLAKQFTDNVGKELAKKLDIYYANFDKIFEFEMIDLDRLEELCGRAYLEKKETSLLKRLCSYENTMININYRLLNSDSNYSYIQDNCLIIYLKLSLDKFKNEIKNDNETNANMAIDIDLYKDRNHLCKEKADIIINCMELDINTIIDLIIVEILKFFDEKG